MVYYLIYPHTLCHSRKTETRESMADLIIDADTLSKHGAHAMFGAAARLFVEDVIPTIHTPTEFDRRARDPLEVVCGKLAGTHSIERMKALADPDVKTDGTDDPVEGKMLLMLATAINCHEEGADKVCAGIMKDLLSIVTSRVDPIMHYTVFKARLWAVSVPKCKAHATKCACDDFAKLVAEVSVAACRTGMARLRVACCVRLLVFATKNGSQCEYATHRFNLAYALLSDTQGHAGVEQARLAARDFERAFRDNPRLAKNHAYMLLRTLGLITELYLGSTDIKQAASAHTEEIKAATLYTEYVAGHVDSLRCRVRSIRLQHMIAGKNMDRRTGEELLKCCAEAEALYMRRMQQKSDKAPAPTYILLWIYVLRGEIYATLYDAGHGIPSDVMDIIKTLMTLVVQNDRTYCGDPDNYLGLCGLRARACAILNEPFRAFAYRNRCLIVVADRERPARENTKSALKSCMMEIVEFADRSIIPLVYALEHALLDKKINWFDSYAALKGGRYVAGILLAFISGGRWEYV